MTKLNVGCGINKWEGYINIDLEESVNPDIICDVRTGKLPYEENSVDEIYFIHTIEHVEKQYWPTIFKEFFRVLQPEGSVILAYPEFPMVAKYYLENKRGMREFFESVVYGRQLYESDYHVSLMDTRVFVKQLQSYGFSEIQWSPEPEPNEYNTILRAQKGTKLKSREDIIREEIFNR